MREHHPELWPAEGDRPRSWRGYVLGPGHPVTVRYHAILKPGEDLTEYPKTLELSWEEWISSHADYGLDIDGQIKP